METEDPQIGETEDPHTGEKEEEADQTWEISDNEEVGVKREEPRRRKCDSRLAEH